MFTVVPLDHQEKYLPLYFPPFFSCDSYLLLKNLQRHSKTGKLDTIAHGELWDRNLLMLDDKVKILDWKNTKLASATLDLAFLMLSSTTSDVRQTCTNDLLKSYHKVFCETLEKFGVSTEEQPSFAEIIEDYQISLQAAILQVSPSTVHHTPFTQFQTKELNPGCTNFKRT